jgi:hypothetical protein
MVYISCVHYDVVKSRNYKSSHATFSSLLLLPTFLYDRVSVCTFLASCGTSNARGLDTPIKSASGLVHYICSESGHDESPCFSPLHCENYSRAHASGDRNCLMYQDEKAIQELGIMEGLSKTSSKPNPRLGHSIMHQPFYHSQLVKQWLSFPRPDRVHLQPYQPKIESAVRPMITTTFSFLIYNLQYLFQQYWYT